MSDSPNKTRALRWRLNIRTQDSMGPAEWSLVRTEPLRQDIGGVQRVESNDVCGTEITGVGSGKTLRAARVRRLKSTFGAADRSGSSMQLKISRSNTSASPGDKLSRLHPYSQRRETIASMLAARRAGM